MTAISSVVYLLVQTLSPVKANILERLLFPAERTVVPFNAGTKGAFAVTNYHASRDATFSFYLNLNIPEYQPALWEEVQKIAGSGATRNGTPVNNGLPIPVNLVITRLDKLGETVVFDQVVREERLESHSQQSFSKIIAAVRLARGNYRVKIEALGDIAAIRRIPVDLDIHLPGNLK